jgi:hypothetical protein
MKKLLLFAIPFFLFSCNKPKKTYYSIQIVKDSFGGRIVHEEKIDTLYLENDSLAMIKNFTSYIISKSLEQNRLKQGDNFLKTEIIDYKLLDSNEKVIVSTLSDEVKKEITADVKKSIATSRTYKSEPTNPEAQFSKWDGSHIKLSEYIKSQMNNPDSYEHVSTKAGTRSDHILLVTTIRGENAYGATITTTYEAKVDSNTGDVISISQQ